MDIRPFILSQTYRLKGGYRRIYHYHVRKSAGTSLNSAFWALGGTSLESMSSKRVVRGRYVFVRHDRRLIQQGYYFFANSHWPAYRLKLPPATFTVTILRDPLARLVSYYRYLTWARDDAQAPRLDPSYPLLAKEIGFLGDSFATFMHNLPPQHLMTQLWMFSKDLEVEEAIDRVTSCSAVGFTEQFESFLSGLSRRLNLPLAIKHERRFAAKVELSTSDLDIARELLAPEIAFVEAVRKACGGDLRDRAREEPSGSATKEVSHPQPADFSC